MFEYKQDIGLLHSAVLSLLRHDSETAQKISEDVTLNSLVKTVRTIISINVPGNYIEEKASCEKLHHIFERLNASLFYTCLKSKGISCTAADKFYGCIQDWPEISFSFYIKFSLRMMWSEYFIKYMQQLPMEVVVEIIKEIKKCSLSTSLKIYSWHLILQAIFYKVLLKSPYKESSSHFLFEFTNSANNASSTISSSEALLEEFNNIYNSLKDEIEQTPNIESMNLLLHSLKTLLKIYNEKQYKDQNLFKNFTGICKILKTVRETDAHSDILKSSLNSFGKESFYPLHTPWGIKEEELIFDLCAYWYEIDVEKDPSELFLFSDLFDENFFEYLIDIHPLTGNASIQSRNHLDYLKKMIQFKCSKSALALKIITSNPDIFEKDEFFTCLEANYFNIDPFKTYKLFIRGISGLKENVNRALKLFFKICQSFKGMYDVALSYILETYGITDKFALLDFEEQYSQFIRKTYSLPEAEKVLPPLFFQSPKTMLEYVVDQALIQGRNGESLIQALKFMPQMCKFKINDVPFLIDIIKKYFKSQKLMDIGAKNVLFFVKTLMNVASESEILKLDDFIDHCILENLHLMCPDVVLILNCLNASLNILMAKDDEFMSKQTLITLVTRLGNLIDDCVNKSKGKVKDPAIICMSLLEKYQKNTGLVDDDSKNALHSHYKSFNPLVCAYAYEFLPKDKVFKSFNFSWILCCKAKKPDLMLEIHEKDPFTMLKLFIVVTRLLPHLTKEEWTDSFMILEALHNRMDFKTAVDEIGAPPEEKDPLLLYTIVSYFINCFHNTFCQEGSDAYYMSDCFTTVLMSVLNQDILDTVHLIFVFLELCYILKNTPEGISYLSTTLLEIKKLIFMTPHSLPVKDLQKLLCSGVSFIPDTPDKVDLYSKIKAKL